MFQHATKTYLAEICNSLSFIAKRNERFPFNVEKSRALIFTAGKRRANFFSNKTIEIRAVQTSRHSRLMAPFLPRLLCCDITLYVSFKYFLKCDTEFHFGFGPLFWLVEGIFLLRYPLPWEHEPYKLSKRKNTYNIHTDEFVREK